MGPDRASPVALWLVTRLIWCRRGNQKKLLIHPVFQGRNHLRNLFIPGKSSKKRKETRRCRNPDQFPGKFIPVVKMFMLWIPQFGECILGEFNPGFHFLTFGTHSELIQHCLQVQVCSLQDGIQPDINHPKRKVLTDGS